MYNRREKLRRLKKRQLEMKKVLLGKKSKVVCPFNLDGIKPSTLRINKIKKLRDEQNEIKYSGYSKKRMLNKSFFSS